MSADTESEMPVSEEPTSTKEASLAEIAVLLSHLKEAANRADAYAAAALQSSKEAAASQAEALASDKAIGLIKVALDTQSASVIEAITSIDGSEGDANAASASISVLLEAAEQNKKDAVDTVAAINEAKNSADKLAASATIAENQIQTALQSVETSKSEIDGYAETVKTTMTDAIASGKKLKALADMAQATEEKIAGYEKRLAEFESQCSKQLQTITDLLPGAGSAGLAYAFEKRQQTFLKPANRWQGLFIATIVFLLLLAAGGAWQILFSAKELALEELLRLWIIRLPIAGGLIWLALHASREAALAKRLEEDYGYKSTIAASFLGFHHHLMKIKEDFKDTPLEKLCSDTLGIIANPPGRIYEKHELTTSLTSKVKETVASVLANQSPKPPTTS